MTLSWTLQAALIIRLCASAVDVTHIPVVCSGIQTQDGYKFPFDLPAGADLSILQGQTTIASWENGAQPELWPEVIRLDKNAVITRTCRDLLIKVSTFDDDQREREHWLNFTATGNPVTPGSQVNNMQFQNNTAKPDLPTAENQTANYGWIAYPFGALIVIIGVPLYFYLSWKKKMSFLWPCNALKKQFSMKAERSEPAETRIPPRCDSANSLDHKLENKEFQPTANGHLNIPYVDIASHHGDMNSVRNMKDDPGGSSGDVRLDIPDFDTKAEAETLVNRGGQDHVSRCSATPKPDVESKPRVKNFGDY